MQTEPVVSTHGSLGGATVLSKRFKSFSASTLLLNDENITKEPKINMATNINLLINFFIIIILKPVC